jgi:hypothetical protein
MVETFEIMTERVMCLRAPACKFIQGSQEDSQPKIVPPYEVLCTPYRLCKLRASCSMREGVMRGLNTAEWEFV